MNRLHRTMGPNLAAYCEALGTARQDSAEALNLSATNNECLSREARLPAHIFGAKCEGIAWSWLKPIKWNILTTETFIKGQPDLIAGPIKIDVKGIHQPSHSLLVQQDADPDWAYLLILGQHPNYQILGWLWGHEAKQSPIKELQPNRPAHVTNQAALFPPDKLFEMVAIERQRRCQLPTS